MNRQIKELTEKFDPRQHLINLGLSERHVDLVQSILRDATTPDEIGRVIRRNNINTALGGVQITSPAFRLLYNDDAVLREKFKLAFAQLELPNGALDAYFQAQQYGSVELVGLFPNIVQLVGLEKLNKFDRDAKEMMFHFLREYFGFLSPTSAASAAASAAGETA